jgi:hypothetical protein
LGGAVFFGYVFLEVLFFVGYVTYVWVYFADASEGFAFGFFVDFVVVCAYFVYVVVAVFVVYFGVFWLVLFDVLGYRVFFLLNVCVTYTTLYHTF